MTLRTADMCDGPECTILLKVDDLDDLVKMAQFDILAFRAASSSRSFEICIIIEPDATCREGTCWTGQAILAYKRWALILVYCLLD